MARSSASARLTLLACLVALAVLLTQLPGPAEALAVLTGTPGEPVAAGDPLAAVQEILLVTAGLLAWLLAAWAVVVLGIGLIARLPGRPGRRARRLLPRLAPASVGRVVLAAVGVSLIAGTAACAAPGPSAPVGAGGTTISAIPTPWTNPAAGTSTAGPSATGSISIDWPDPATATTSAQSPAGIAPVASPAASLPTTPTTAPSATPTAESSATPWTPSTAAPPASTPSPPPSEAPPSSTPSEAPPSSTPAEARSEAPPPPAPSTASLPAEPTPPVDQADPAPEGSDRAVTVQPGDSLWRIAAHTLGPDATGADIDNAWRAWYFVNREVIGDDPDVILPGQDLIAPASAEQVRP